MSMYGKNHYNIVISLKILKINEKKKKKNNLFSKLDARESFCVCVWKDLEMAFINKNALLCSSSRLEVV